MKKKGAQEKMESSEFQQGVIGALVLLALICALIILIHMLIAIVTYKRAGSVIRLFLVGLFSLAFAVFMMPDKQKPDALKSTSLPSFGFKSNSRSKYEATH